MKRVLQGLVCVILISGKINGQFLNGVSDAVYFTEKAQFEERCLKAISDTMHVVVGYGPEYDAAIKVAFEKYWTISKFKLISLSQFDKLTEDQKDKRSFIVLREMSYNLGKDTYFDLIQIINCEKAGSYNKKLVEYSAVGLRYDNLHRKGEKSLGTVSNDHDRANTTIQYVMEMQQQLKLITELGEKKYKKLSNKEKLKGKTIILSREYLKVGITEASFKKLGSKCEVMDADVIRKKLQDKKGLEACCQMYIIRSLDTIDMFIIDLETGDLIASSYYNSSGNGKRNKSVDDEDMYILAKQLE
jgi:hypothetical protein